MKYVFYILILANVVFFLWETNIIGQGGGTAASYRELRLPHTVERIALLSERSAPPEKNTGVALADPSVTQAAPEPSEGETPEPVQQADVPAPESGCFQWGPVADEARAREVLNLVKAQSDQAALVRKPSDLTDGWWVLFPKAHDLEAAKSNRKMLLEKGVTDLWLFDKGPLQGAISLGLFKTRARAEQAQKKFTEQGVITEVVPRLVQSEAYWVRIPWTRPVPELEAMLKPWDGKRAADQRLPPVPCD